MELKKALFKRKPKSSGRNACSYFEAKTVLVRLIADEFTAKIGNFCNNFLDINNVMEILDHGCSKRCLWQGRNNFKL